MDSATDIVSGIPYSIGGASLAVFMSNIRTKSFKNVRQENGDTKHTTKSILIKCITPLASIKP